MVAETSFGMRLDSLKQIPREDANSVREPGFVPKLRISGLNFYYGAQQALFDISVDVPERRVTALIGPSGCGKSTFLRALNRMYETVPHARAEGTVLLDNDDILAMDVVRLRRRVGMLFQKSNPFPKSIFDNVAYGLRVNSRLDKSALGGQGGGQGPAGQGKGGLERVADDFEHRPTVGFDGAAQQGMMQRYGRAHGFGHLLPQGRAAFNIGEQEGHRAGG